MAVPDAASSSDFSVKEIMVESNDWNNHNICHNRLSCGEWLLHHVQDVTQNMTFP